MGFWGKYFWGGSRRTGKRGGGGISISCVRTVHVHAVCSERTLVLVFGLCVCPLISYGVCANSRTPDTGNPSPSPLPLLVGLGNFFAQKACDLDVRRLFGCWVGWVVFYLVLFGCSFYAVRKMNFRYLLSTVRRISPMTPQAASSPIPTVAMRKGRGRGSP